MSPKFFRFPFLSFDILFDVCMRVQFTLMREVILQRINSVSLNLQQGKVSSDVFLLLGKKCFTKESLKLEVKKTY